MDEFRTLRKEDPGTDLKSLVDQKGGSTKGNPSVEVKNSALPNMFNHSLNTYFKICFNLKVPLRFALHMFVNKSTCD